MANSRRSALARSRAVPKRQPEPAESSELRDRITERLRDGKANAGDTLIVSGPIAAAAALRELEERLGSDAKTVRIVNVTLSYDMRDIDGFTGDLVVDPSCWRLMTGGITGTLATMIANRARKRPRKPDHVRRTHTRGVYG